VGNFLRLWKSTPESPPADATLHDFDWLPEAGISGRISNGSGIIEAQVQDDGSVRRVWAVIYPPDYEPPSEAEELVQDQDIVPTLVLRDQGNDQYAATFTAFDQMGSYRIVIYAEDNDNYEARPLSLHVQTATNCTCLR